MMKFIHKLTIVLALGGICGLAACSDDDQGFLKRNLREMSFPYVESSDTFTIRATGDWQISDTPDSREWTNAYGWVPFEIQNPSFFSQMPTMPWSGAAAQMATLQVSSRS